MDFKPLAPHFARVLLEMVSDPFLFLVRIIMVIIYRNPSLLEQQKKEEFTVSTTRHLTLRPGAMLNISPEHCGVPQKFCLSAFRPTPLCDTPHLSTGECLCFSEPHVEAHDQPELLKILQLQPQNNDLSSCFSPSLTVLKNVANYLSFFSFGHASWLVGF